jgi:hypothetical protein
MAICGSLANICFEAALNARRGVTVAFMRDKVARRGLDTYYTEV